LKIHEEPFHPATIGSPRGEAFGLQWQYDTIRVDETDLLIERQFAIGKGNTLGNGPRCPIDTCRFGYGEGNTFQDFLS